MGAIDSHSSIPLVLVRELIQRGVDLLADHNGNTSFDFALLCLDPEVADYISQLPTETKWLNMKATEQSTLFSRLRY